MQVTGGQYKGRKLAVPDGARPTLSIVRESVFNVLFSQFGNLENKNMLDMFLGSGIMTLEAISRGLNVTSYEINRSVIKCARENVKALGALCDIRFGDCIKGALKSGEKYDVIYADPPYNNPYDGVIKVCKNCLKVNGIAIIECDKRKNSEIARQINAEANLEFFKQKNYGRCCLLFVKLS